MEKVDDDKEAYKHGREKGMGEAPTHGNGKKYTNPPAIALREKRRECKSQFHKIKETISRKVSRGKGWDGGGGGSRREEGRSTILAEEVTKGERKTRGEQNPDHLRTNKGKKKRGTRPEKRKPPQKISLHEE